MLNFYVAYQYAKLAGLLHLYEAREPIAQIESWTSYQDISSMGALRCLHTRENLNTKLTVLCT